ncbi:hypothetical protein IQ272_14850 [Chroococcidiopsidales cyanobacterium LEGE 13417]|nr:hypothetical protein [Chroococcidiopsis sp. CCALA 051]MBE9017390.1 hypothetical protein [Chroococcidiopsidales cyanobacterium LEGE 13417]
MSEEEVRIVLRSHSEATNLRGIERKAWIVLQFFRDARLCAPKDVFSSSQ